MSFQDYQCFGNETEYQQWHPEKLGHWEVLGEWCTEEYGGLVQRLEPDRVGSDPWSPFGELSKLTFSVSSSVKWR